MSKEVEALNYLVSLAVVGNKENHRGKIFESEEIVFQVLKRNEPMRPIYEKDGTRSCPCCKGNWLTPNFKFCSDCGQKLDWSDEE